MNAWLWVGRALHSLVTVLIQVVSEEKCAYLVAGVGHGECG